MNKIGRAKQANEDTKKDAMSYENYHCNYHENVVCALVKMRFCVVVGLIWMSANKIKCVCVCVCVCMSHLTKQKSHVETKKKQQHSNDLNHIVPQDVIVLY